MTQRMRSLEVRGLSRNGIQLHHPLPEKPTELVVSEPEKFDQLDILSPDGSDTLMASSCASLTSGRLSNGSPDSSTWSVGTDNVTGRSSVYSWGNDDDFDQEASANVRQMFDEIDGSLFERVQSKRCDAMKEECSDWSSTFPHLRVLGTQLMQSADNGTQMVQAKHVGRRALQSAGHTLLEDVENESIQTDVEHTGLAVSGRRVEAVLPPEKQPNSRLDDSSSVASYSMSLLEEEVFAVDGEVEEILAYDNNSLEEKSSLQEKLRMRKYRNGAIPPVTPHAFVRDTVISECFDHVWNEVITVLRDVLQMYLERIRRDFVNKHASRYFERTGPGALGLYVPPSRDGMGRMPPLPGQLRLKTSSGYAHSDLNALNELMTIRSVALQHRAPSASAYLIREAELPPAAPPKDLYMGRPASSSLGNQRYATKPVSRNGEANVYDRLVSAKTPKRTTRLQPLHQPLLPLDLVRTPGYQDGDSVGEVRGTRMQTAIDRLSPRGMSILTPGPWGSRSGALPPLERVETADTFLGRKDRARSPKRSTNRASRASSAATGESRATTQKVRTSSTLPDSRPSTTQTFRAEISPIGQLKRLTTPLSHQTPPKHRDVIHGHTLAPRALLLGIGSLHQNVGESPVPLQAASRQLPFDEGAEEFDDFVLWGHGPPLLSHQRRKGRTSNTNMR